MTTLASTPDVLQRIVDAERAALPRRRAARSGSALRESLHWGRPRIGLESALTARSPAVIAECKRRSPSKGILRDPYDPVAIATAYREAGAAAISVLTNEEFFGGTLADLEAVRCAVDLPLLRKDFVFDDYQIEEARAAGADAILLICAMLERASLVDLLATAAELGLDALVEVHEAAELDDALAVGARLIGINNRNLRTFQVDLTTTEALAPRVGASAVVVGESGIATAADVQRLRRVGVDAFLVGETFMRSADPGAPLRALCCEAGPFDRPGRSTTDRRSRPEASLGRGGDSARRS